MVQLPLLDREHWNCTRHRVECHAIGHSGTGVSETFLQLDTCVWNSASTDTCAFGAAKVDTCLRN